jgi:long-chain fatty acid transport protein
VTPDLKIGFSAGSNFGGSLQYEKSWAGRYYGTKDELITLGAWPVAAYKVNNWLSIGGGAQILYGRLDTKTSVVNIRGGSDGQIQLKDDDVGFGGIAGILIEPTKDTRFGVTYTSPVKFNFNEKPDLNNGGGRVFDALDPRISQTKINMDLTVPQTVMVSGYHDLTPDIAIMGNVTWQQWSEFGKPSLEISNRNTRKATVDLDYDDTWGVALGGRWRFLPNWSWSVGGSYDSSPMSESERTPALPLDQQFRIGTGVQYALNENVTLGAAYEYANLGKADIDVNRGPLSGRLQGDYSTNEVHFFNMTAGWTF